MIESIFEQEQRLLREGWGKWPNDKKPNTKENLFKYDFISAGFTLWYREKK